MTAPRLTVRTVATSSPRHLHETNQAAASQGVSAPICVPAPIASPGHRRAESDPLEVIMRQAVLQARSLLVRRWLAALLRRGERAQQPERIAVAQVADEEPG